MHPEQWLEEAANDLRYGTARTWVGRAAKTVGAQPLYNNVSPQTAEVMGGPALGPLKGSKGALEVAGSKNTGELLHGASDIVGGIAQTTAPFVAATNPEFLPLAVEAAGVSKAIGGTARVLGASPQTANDLENVGTAAALSGVAKLANRPQAQAITRPVETLQAASEAVPAVAAKAVEGPAAAATAARDSGAGSVLLGPRPQSIEPVTGVVRAIRARNSVRNFPQAVATALPAVRNALDDLGVEPEKMGVRDFEAAISRAKTNTWNQLQSNVLGPNSHVELNVGPVADAIQGVARGMTPMAASERPGLVGDISDASANYQGARMPMEMVEKRIQELNNELRSAQSTYKVNQDALRNNPQYGYKFAELDALRKIEGDAFNRIAGAGAGRLKSQYGALKTLQDATDRRIPVIERQAQMKTFEGAGKLFGAANMIGGAVRGSPGEFARGAAEFQIGRNIQKMNDPEFLLRAAMSNTKASNRPFTTGVPPAATPPMNRGLSLEGYNGPVAPNQRALPGAPERLQLGAGRFGGPVTGPGSVEVTPPPPVGQGTTASRTGRNLLPSRTTSTRTIVPPQPAEETVPEPIRVLRAKSALVRDPKTGRMKRMYLSSPE